MRNDFNDSDIREVDKKGRIVKVVDFRLPFWGAVWSIGACVLFLAWSAITIWFQVQNMTTSLNSLQTSVAQISTDINSSSSDMALLKLRESILEDKVKDISNVLENEKR